MSDERCGCVRTLVETQAMSLAAFEAWRHSPRGRRELSRVTNGYAHADCERCGGTGNGKTWCGCVRTQLEINRMDYVEGRAWQGDSYVSRVTKDVDPTRRRFARDACENCHGTGVTNGMPRLPKIPALPDLSGLLPKVPPLPALPPECALEDLGFRPRYDMVDSRFKYSNASRDQILDAALRLPSEQEILDAIFTAGVIDRCGDVARDSATRQQLAVCTLPAGHDGDHGDPTRGSGTTPGPTWTRRPKDAPGAHGSVHGDVRTPPEGRTTPPSASNRQVDGGASPGLCPSTITRWHLPPGKRETRCEIDEGHEGDVHRDAEGYSWSERYSDQAHRARLTAEGWCTCTRRSDGGNLAHVGRAIVVNDIRLGAAGIVISADPQCSECKGTGKALHLVVKYEEALEAYVEVRFSQTTRPPTKYCGDRRGEYSCKEAPGEHDIHWDGGMRWAADIPGRCPSLFVVKSHTERCDLTPGHDGPHAGGSGLRARTWGVDKATEKATTQPAPGIIFGTDPATGPSKRILEVRERDGSVTRVESYEDAVRLYGAGSVAAEMFRPRPVHVPPVPIAPWLGEAVRLPAAIEWLRAAWRERTEGRGTITWDFDSKAPPGMEVLVAFHLGAWHSERYLVTGHGDEEALINAWDEYGEHIAARWLAGGGR